MDIVVRGPEPTEAERLSVDAVLGPPESAWSGGQRDLQREGRIALLGGSDARSLRHRLLPVLHAVQDRFGWLPPGALAYVSKRLTIPPAEVHGVATFYHLFSMNGGAPVHVHVCDDIACRHLGGLGLLADLKKRHSGSKTVEIHPSPCLGLCERAPTALVLRSGANPQGCAVGHATADLVASALVPDSFPDEGMDWLSHAAPQRNHAEADLALLSRVGRCNPLSLEEFKATGGFAGLRKAIDSRGDFGGYCRARWRRFSHRPQVGCCGQIRRCGTLCCLQRRRIGTGHLQGSCGDGGRSVCPCGRHGDCRFGCGFTQRLSLHSWRISAGHTSYAACNRLRPTSKPAG